MYMQTAFTYLMPSEISKKYTVCAKYTLYKCVNLSIYIYICHPVFEHYMENGPFIDDKHDDEALNRMMFQLANRKS